MADDDNTINDGIDFVNAGITDGDAEWDGTNDPPPPGDYLFEVSDASRKLSKKKKEPYLNIKAQVLSLPDGKPTPAAGKNLFGIYMEVGGGKSRLVTLLRATGALKDGGYALSTMKGRRFVGTVIHEEYTKSDAVTLEESTRVQGRIVKERPAL